jgi:hypothetical protein
MCIQGLLTPNEAIFQEYLKLLGLGRQIGLKRWGIWGIFGQTISTHFGTVSPLSIFPLINHYFYKKLSLFTQIPNIYMRFGYEFGL